MSTYRIQRFGVAYLPSSQYYPIDIELRDPNLDRLNYTLKSNWKTSPSFSTLKAIYQFSSREDYDIHVCRFRQIMGYSLYILQGTHVEDKTS